MKYECVHHIYILKNALGKKILFISHKDGNGPKAFGQYGGVSTKAGGADDASQIYNHPIYRHQYIS